MGYSTEEDTVRVDFFKPSGKWYTDIAMKWTGGYSDIYIFDAFKKSLRDAVGDSYSGMTAVCLEPYHEHAHPLMVSSWEEE